MNRTLLKIIFFLASFSLTCAFGQTVQPAEPVSDKNYLKEFICKEVVYPERSIQDKEEGEVTLSFFVQDDGEVSNIRVEESVSPEIDAEAIRVFRMILWKPAVRLGQPVASRKEFSMKFDIRKYEKNCRERGYERHETPYSPVDSSMNVYKPSQVDILPNPVFEDPAENLGNFLRSEFKYPEQAYKQSISGTSEIRFVVEKHGTISNVEVARSVGGGCNEEAIRLISMLNWMPGIRDGAAVRTQMSMEISFRLPGDSGVRIFDYNFNNSL